MAKISTITEAFSGNIIDTSKWTLTNVPPIIQLEKSNHLEQSPATNNAAYGGIISISTGDLTGDRCYIMIPQVLNSAAPSAETQFAVGPDGNNRFLIGINAGNIYFRTTVGGVNTPADTVIPYNPVNHLWVSFREANGSVYYETSPDGYTWTTQRTSLSPFAITACVITLQVGTYNPEPIPGTTIWDNLNLRVLTKSTFKRFYYKVYATTSYWDKAYWDLNHWDYDPLQSWEGDIISDPTFITNINSGPGKCVVQLRRPFDNFGENVDVTLNRRVEIFVVDNDAPNATLLYAGFISSYAPIIDKGKEYVEITLMGYSTELSWYMLQDSSGNTALTYTAQDPSNVFEDIIDLYVAQGGQLNYNPSSIQLTGTLVTYTFNLNTIKEALDYIIQLCPQKWYYSISSQNVISLQGPSTVTDHKFLIGKNIEYMKPVKDITNVVNDIYFVGGVPAGQSQLYRRYTRGSSTSSYGNKAMKMQDQRMTLTSSSDLMAGRYLDYYQNPLVQTEIHIADSNGQDVNKGYDIESVQVGQNIAVLNLKGSSKAQTTWDIATWDVTNWDYLSSFITSDILQIQSVEYHPDNIIIQAAVALPYVQKTVRQVEHQLQNYTQATIPVKPTAVVQ